MCLICFSTPYYLSNICYHLQLVQRSMNILTNTLDSRPPPKESKTAPKITCNQTYAVKALSSNFQHDATIKVDDFRAEFDDLRSERQCLRQSWGSQRRVECDGECK